MPHKLCILVSEQPSHEHTYTHLLIHSLTHSLNSYAHMLIYYVHHLCGIAPICSSLMEVVGIIETII